MANKHLALRITALTIEPNARTGQTAVTNRFVFQLLHPTRQDDNPAASFAVGSVSGPVPAEDLDAALPDALVFKGQPFAQAFDEPLRIRIHHFHDIHRDWLQVAVGKLFKAVLTAFLGKVSLVTVSLTDVINPLESLDIGGDTCSQKLGYFELVVDPKAGRGGRVRTVSVALAAPEDVLGFSPLGPDGQPKRICIVSAGETTAAMDLEIALS